MPRGNLAGRGRRGRLGRGDFAGDRGLHHFRLLAGTADREAAASASYGCFDRRTDRAYRRSVSSIGLERVDRPTIRPAKRGGRTAGGGGCRRVAGIVDEEVVGSARSVLPNAQACRRGAPVAGGHRRDGRSFQGKEDRGPDVAQGQGNGQEIFRAGNTSRVEGPGGTGFPQTPL